MSRRIRWLALTLAMAGAPPARADPAENPIARGLCEKAIQCGEVAARDRTNCVRSLGSLFGDAALEQKRLVVDAKQERVCVSKIAHLHCEQFSLAEARRGKYTDPDDACGLVLKGNVAQGGLCAQDDECKSGYCDRALDEIGAFKPGDGRCRPLRALGESCRPDHNAECGAHAFCNGKCVSRGKKTEHCGWRGDKPCDAGLVCNPNAETDGTPSVCVSLSGR
jgi:hypothetical protein